MKNEAYIVQGRHKHAQVWEEQGRHKHKVAALTQCYELNENAEPGWMYRVVLESEVEA